MLERLAGGLEQSSSIELVHIETWPIGTNDADPDTNITLAPDFDGDGLYRAYSFGRLGRASNVQSQWFNESTYSRFGTRHTLMHDRSTPTLFPLKIAYVTSENELMATAGNSVSRVQDTNFFLDELTPFAPSFVRFRGIRHLIWWTETDQLMIGEMPESDQLINRRLIKAADDNGGITLRGEFQPTAIEHNGRLYVLSQYGQLNTRTDTLSLSVSDDGVSWQHQSIELSISTPPRPVITVLDGRLFIFFHGHRLDAYVRYISSADGESWSPERDLPIPESFDSEGHVGVQGGIGVAPYRDGLAVSWISLEGNLAWPTRTAYYEIAN
ncbi:MAG: sialidase family protein [Pseudomonadota bacterium]